MNIITSNKIDNLRSLKEDNENFIVSHLYLIASKIPTINKQYQIVIDSYYKDGNEDDYNEDYVSDNDIVYNFYPVSYLSEITKSISKKVIDNIDYNPGVIVSGEPTFNKLICSDLNRLFRDCENEMECMDILKYFKMTTLQKLTEYLRKTLNSEFVYEDDPISYSYVINTVMNRGGL